ncbi:hypothetical protein DAQ1742_01755 [Dickeya aquatica]|uniref:Polyketide cyclase n=1 Tax=Dickeya aquatica TaxID=1401087 RepID=A0A375A9G8_9GAMM|nr:hypothetical protein DAQ1742_01755 [Dickeya aquatica]
MKPEMLNDSLQSNAFKNHEAGTPAAVSAPLSAIIWPQGYLPGWCDNFASNEMIVAQLSVEPVWQALVNTALWPDYYPNASDIHFHHGNAPWLAAGTRFCFTTFGFVVEAEVVEFVPPQPGQLARLAWHGWVEGEAETLLDVHHAWLIEALPGHRLRLLTQETQHGAPARELAGTRPNPMINGHQQWLDGLLATAFRTEASFPG